MHAKSLFFSGVDMTKCVAKSVELQSCFSSALSPGSSQIANSYLPPQARLKALTIGLWLEFKLGFNIQPSSSSSYTHMRGEAQRKIWKRYILAKQPSKPREMVANIRKEGKMSQCVGRVFFVLLQTWVSLLVNTLHSFQPVEMDSYWDFTTIKKSH